VPFRAREVTELCAPMFHALGFAQAMVGIGLGSTLVIRRRFDPRETLESLQRHRATAMVMVPVMLQRILELPVETIQRYDLSALRVVAASGSALPGELATRVMDAFEALTNKKLSIWHWAEDWKAGATYLHFQSEYMQAVRDRGGIPMLTWGSGDSHFATVQPDSVNLSTARRGVHSLGAQTGAHCPKSALLSALTRVSKTVSVSWVRRGLKSIPPRFSPERRNPPRVAPDGFQIAGV